MRDEDKTIEDCGRSAGEPAFAAESAATAYRQWLEYPDLDEATRSALLQMQGRPDLIRQHFGAELTFGTGGMRGVIGPGTNRLNIYLVRRLTQGLANYLNRRATEGTMQSVAIAYDTRAYSREFATEAALVLAANGIKGLLFAGVRPTPELSFAIRERRCAAGIVITASHNPPQYNGYKVYGPDGGQAVSPFIDELIEEIAAVDLFAGVRTMERAAAEEQGLLELIGEQLDSHYIAALHTLSLSQPAEPLTVVYTPLHGTGAVLLPRLLNSSGYIEVIPVAEQMLPDANFSTVKVPNPEEPAAFTMALALARQYEADLVLATDPDCDRVGCAVRGSEGEYTLLTGNQTGALLLEYILGRLQDRGTLPPDGVMVKTIVTGDLGRRVADAYGVRTEETLTGFKYIGAKIEEFEKAGTGTFLFGYEESYGYLAGTFVRDKDALGTSLLLCEAAAYYKEKGMTLLQLLEELSRRYGYFREDLVSLELEDLSKADQLMCSFAQMPPLLDGVKLTEKRDYYEGKAWLLPDGTEKELTLPRSKVLYYRLADDSWFCIRPSGTEPKIKIYFSVNAAAAAEADQKLQRLKKAVLTAAGL